MTLSDDSAVRHRAQNDNEIFCSARFAVTLSVLLYVTVFFYQQQRFLVLLIQASKPQFKVSNLVSEIIKSVITFEVIKLTSWYWHLTKTLV